MTELRNIDIDSLPNVLKDTNFFKGGAYGSIQLITWQKKHCAVKYFRKRDNYQKNFSEVNNLHICDHRNIVKLYGAGPDIEQQKLYYYIMEFATNGSLDELLHEQKEVFYSLAQGLNWIFQCAQGVEYLHTHFTHPIIHRDIKPANILLFEHGKLVKLCDFGTVKSVKNSENTAESGTYIYMAPEVMCAFKDRTANYNEKCDVYSLAIIMWEILTRQKPFKNAPNVFSIMNTVYIKNERLEEIPDCPLRLQKLIKCCWRQNYKERPNISEVCKILSIILKRMDNVDESLAIKSYIETDIEEDLSLDCELENNKVGHSSESFEIQMELVDKSLKPNEPLQNNVESKMIFDQHQNLLIKFVNLHLECQYLELENNTILNQITSDNEEKSRIKKYCGLKIKQQQQISLQ